MNGADANTAMPVCTSLRLIQVTTVYASAHLIFWHSGGSDECALRHGYSLSHILGLYRKHALPFSLRSDIVWFFAKIVTVSPSNAN